MENFAIDSITILIKVKPSNRNSKLHDSTGGNASLKKVEVNPSIRNSKLDDREGVMLR